MTDRAADGPTSVAAVVARRIGEVRRLRGWTQLELADRLADSIGIEQSTIARIEGGKRKVSVSDLLEIADALGCSPVVLLTPLDPNDEVVVGSNSTSGRHLGDWIRGFKALPHQDDQKFRETMAFEDRLVLSDGMLQYQHSLLRSQAKALAAGDVAGADEIAQDLSDAAVSIVGEGEIDPEERFADHDR
jgi:transcriptional regulator with XRE-family HTH domain